jgi:N-acetylglucosamine-6-phosphate deacetylase
MRDPELSPHLLGVHLEGPFISPEPGAVGAHQPQYVRLPSVEDLDRLCEWAEGSISLLTLAPERPGAPRLIEAARERGIVVSLGHHLADDLALETAVNAGAAASTHLGNGLPNEIHRHKNPLWWQLACDSLYGTFITDGHHLPPSMIKVALRAKTADRFIVISDASPLAGMPPGGYESFGKRVMVEPSGRISCEESRSLAGSHSTMFECMNYLASLNLLSEADLWKVGFANPLKLLGRSVDCKSFVGRVV